MDDELLNKDIIRRKFENKSVHLGMMGALMLNYNICHKKYALIFDKIEINKRPMGVKGCKSVTNHRLHNIEQKVEMYEHRFMEYETEIMKLKDNDNQTQQTIQELKQMLEIQNQNNSDNQ